MWSLEAFFGNSLSGRAGNDSIFGLAGDDVLNGGADNDLLDGGEGSDTASYENAAAGVFVTLNSTLAQDTGGDGIDTLVSIENLIGSNHNDLLFGTDFSNTLYGMDGSDYLFGFDGNDTLIGGLGEDYLQGGGGVDLASYVYATGRVVVSLEKQGAAQNTRSDGLDTLFGIEKLMGSDFNDLQIGDSGVNRLYGRDGNDTLYGKNAPDVIDGGAGNDRLFGGFGADTLTGGVGEDRFIYDEALDLGSNLSRADVITDFSSLEGDRINLADVDSDSVTGGNQNFAFVGTAAFSNTAGEMRYYFDGG